MRTKSQSGNSKAVHHVYAACRVSYPSPPMTLYENRASKEMYRLPEMVHTGPANTGSATVLLEGKLQESE
jgi:hypothetical protein